MPDIKRSYPIMEVRNLSFGYGADLVLEDVSLGIEAGRVTTILGSNGCGKSTLFNLMTKSLQPRAGKVFLEGSDIAGLSIKEFARRVSIVHQHNTAADDITVASLVTMGRAPYARFMGAPSAEDERMVSWAMEVTGVAGLRDREVSRLSGGQRQRVWIAMALAQNTKVLFLDEPTTYLDIRYQVEILGLVRRLNREFGITIVMVLHDINQAIHYSDRIIGLKQGRVLVAGDPSRVISSRTIHGLFGVHFSVVDIAGRRYALQTDDGLQAERRDAASSAEDEGFGRSSGDGGARTLGAEAPVSSAPGECAGDDGAAGGDPEPADDGAVPDAGAANAFAPGGGEPALAKSRLACVLWTVLGLFCLGLGVLGAALPVLPTVPFLLAALFCFARGSKRLHDWFVRTGLYRKHLESYAAHRAMTLKTKAGIMTMVTLVMAAAFCFMHSLPGRGVLLAVWIFHVVFFTAFVKTQRGEACEDDAAREGGFA